MFRAWVGVFLAAKLLYDFFTFDEKFIYDLALLYIVYSF